MEMAWSIRRSRNVLKTYTILETVLEQGYDLIETIIIRQVLGGLSTDKFIILLNPRWRMTS